MVMHCAEGPRPWGMRDMYYCTWMSSSRTAITGRKVTHMDYYEHICLSLTILDYEVQDPVTVCCKMVHLDVSSFRHDSFTGTNSNEEGPIGPISHRQWAQVAWDYPMDVTRRSRRPTSLDRHCMDDARDARDLVLWIPHFPGCPLDVSGISTSARHFIRAFCCSLGDFHVCTL